MLDSEFLILIRSESSPFSRIGIENSELNIGQMPFPEKIRPTLNSEFLILIRSESSPFFSDWN